MAREPIDDNGVLALPGMGPAPGTVYKNRAVNTYATVVAVLQRRQCWVLIRKNDREDEIPLADLDRYWEPV